MSERVVDQVSFYLQADGRWVWCACRTDFSDFAGVGLTLALAMAAALAASGTADQEVSGE